MEATSSAQELLAHGAVSCHSDTSKSKLWLKREACSSSSLVSCCLSCTTFSSHASTQPSHVMLAVRGPEPIADVGDPASQGAWARWTCHADTSVQQQEVQHARLVHVGGKRNGKMLHPEPHGPLARPPYLWNVLLERIHLVHKADRLSLVKSFLFAFLSLRFLNYHRDATMVNLLLLFVLFHSKSN